MRIDDKTVEKFDDFYSFFNINSSEVTDSSFNESTKAIKLKNIEAETIVINWIFFGGLVAFGIFFIYSTIRKYRKEKADSVRPLRRENYCNPTTGGNENERLGKSTNASEFTGILNSYDELQNSFSSETNLTSVVSFEELSARNESPPPQDQFGPTKIFSRISTISYPAL